MTEERAMPGKNEIHMNKATMIKAVQYYLDHVLLKVTGVYVTDVDKTGNAAYDNSFVIKLTEEE